MRISIWRHFDFWLLGAVAILTILGITMIRSAVAGNIDLADHAQRQLIFAVAGFVILFGVAAIDYRYWSSVSNAMYLGTALALVVLNVIATAVFGSARWFNLFLINIQPSELAKIVMILVLADFFARHYHQMGEVRWILRSFLMAMGIIIWVVLQPNLSTSIVMLVIWFSLLWAAGLRVKHLLIFALVGLVILAITLPLLIQFEIIQDYQISRITNFLAPEEDARYGETYNVQQALISIGSGGLFGQGYGHGSQVQLRFLKVRHSDFIFSAMAEEFGLVGVTVTMLVMLFVILRCLRAARLSLDTFGALICYGVAALLSFQAIVNIGVNLNLVPVTGLTLPFISYGGSSLVTNLIGIGLVESVVLRHKALDFAG
jgi:rod shape determining protein RodA